MSAGGAKSLLVAPASRAAGRIELPGDKSISHRALILAAVAEGRSTIENIGAGEDVAATARGLSSLGASIRRDGASAVVDGKGWDSFRSGGGVDRPIDCGNSGTTARLLAGLLAARPGMHVLDGDPSLRRRPMERVAAPLALFGARVATDGTLPMTIRGGALEGADVSLDSPSAQVKGAVILAALQAKGGSRVVQRSETRDHTERIVADLGGGVSRDDGDGALRVAGGSKPLAPWCGRVPGDPSAAAFFAALAAALPGERVEIARSSVNRTRLTFFDVLREMGASVLIERDDRPAVSGEPSGSIVVTGAPLRGVALSGETARACIDEIPVLAVLASRAKGPSSFAGLGELRFKESDRLRAIRELVVATGGEALIRDDVLTVEGGGAMAGGRFDPSGDHRMAMAAAIAGALSTSGVTIVGPEIVAVSHPTFFEDLSRLAGVGGGPA